MFRLVRRMRPMTRSRLRLGLAGLMTLAAPALAHHAVQSEFDMTWVFETAAPNGLRRAGFSQKGVFKIGGVHLRRLPGTRRLSHGLSRVAGPPRRPHSQDLAWRPQ